MLGDLLHAIVVSLGGVAKMFRDEPFEAMWSSSDALERAIASEDKAFASGSRNEEKMSSSPGIDHKMSSSADDLHEAIGEEEDAFGETDEGGTWMVPPAGDAYTDKEFPGTDLHVSYKYEKQANGYSPGDVVYYRSEAALSRMCGVSWQNRGPRPGDGPMPNKWKGNTWRPEAKKWATRGGKHKEHYGHKFSPKGWGTKAGIKPSLSHDV
jgi:hypothetical protein